MSCHGFGLFEPHQVEDRRRYVGQDTVADRFTRSETTTIGTGLSEWAVLGVPSALTALSRCRDRRSARPRTRCEGRLDDFGHARIDSLHRFLDRLINSRMPHHIAVGEIQADEIVFLPVECPDQLVGHLVSAHLG